MTRRELARWEKLRGKGKRHFVLVHGVVGWGGTMAVVMPLVTWLLDSIDPDPLNPPNLLQGFLIGLLFFPIGGYIWGVFIWSVMEKRYAKHLQGEEQSSRTLPQ